MENNIRINPLKYPNIKCQCGCVVWNQGVILKRVSGLETGNGTEDTYVDLPVWYCIKCGEILPEYKKIYKLEEKDTKDIKDTQAPKSDNPSPLLIV